MSSKFTHEVFLEKTKAINENIEFLEEYSGSKNRIKCRCTIDGYEWNPLARNLLEGHGCKMCFIRNQKMPRDDFFEIIKSVNPNIEILGNYNGLNHKIECRCLIDGHEWSPLADKLIRGSGCPKCAKNHRLSNDEFVNRLRIVNNNIIPLDEYDGSVTKIRFRCEIDGYIWSAKPHLILSGEGCPKCAKRATVTQEEFLERVKNVNDSIIPLEEYIDASTPIRFQCKRDGNIWRARPYNIYNGSGCPVCNESKGEKNIRIYLQNNRIDFIAQKEFDGLIGLGGGNLKYDFYIEDINLLIEYQGVQHERPVNFERNGNAEERFEYRQEHDRRKREYAKSHNIDLLEIWYYDFDRISEILDEYLGNKAAA